MRADFEMRRHGGRFVWSEIVAIVAAEPYWKTMLPGGKLGPARGSTGGRPGWTLGTLAAVIMVLDMPGGRPASHAEWRQRGREIRDLEERVWRAKREHLDNRLMRGKAKLRGEDVRQIVDAVTPPEGFASKESQHRLLRAFMYYGSTLRLAGGAQVHATVGWNDVISEEQVAYQVMRVIGEVVQDEQRRERPDEPLEETDPALAALKVFRDAPPSPDAESSPYPPEGYVGPINWY